MSPAPCYLFHVALRPPRLSLAAGSHTLASGVAALACTHALLRQPTTVASSAATTFLPSRRAPSVLGKPPRAAFAAPSALSVFDGLAARSAPRIPTARFAGFSPARPHLAGTGVCLGCFAPRLAVARYTRRPCAANNMIRGLLYSSHPRGWGLRLCASLGGGAQCKAESSRVILERRSRLLRQGIL